MTKTPMSIPLPEYAVQEMVANVDFDDERLWVPRDNNVESIPLLFCVTQGSWVNITRARGDGIISRHRHSSPVTGYTLAGAWGYLEHAWTATVGTFIFEPPGETHTLIVKPDPSDASSDHMMVLFHNFGPLMHVDDAGEVIGYVDVFTRIESCKSHYIKCGLGSDFIERLIR
ncbi:MAG: 2,4'-dihydroxyacetophenone dioxygenase family protein [Granulosicoccus sp.]|nr:2,4'-dihydroxyacetophenone dioxygenase family protein [Granulosicoccus sp.]